MKELEAETDIKKKIKIITEKKNNKFKIIPEIPESDNKKNLIYKKKFKKDIKKYKKRMKIKLETEKKNSISEKNSDIKKTSKLK